MSDTTGGVILILIFMLQSCITASVVKNATWPNCPTSSGNTSTAQACSFKSRTPEYRCFMESDEFCEFNCKDNRAECLDPIHNKTEHWDGGSSCLLHQEDSNKMELCYKMDKSVKYVSNANDKLGSNSEFTTLFGFKDDSSSKALLNRIPRMEYAYLAKNLGKPGLPASEFRVYNWMKHVSDNQMLSQMTIPGTHDTACFNSINVPLLTTQDLCPKNQLMSGIRFLDVRLGIIKGFLRLFHGPVDVNLDFEQLMQTCILFLKNFNTEAIIMSIKLDGPGSDKDFLKVWNNDVYAPFHRHMVLKKDIPTLGEVRGKIVIWSRITDLKGLQHKDAVDDDHFDGIKDPEHKWGFVKGHLEKAAKILPTDGSTFYITFASYSTWSIIEGAAAVNQHLYKYITSGAASQNLRNDQNEYPIYGIIPMDFPDRTHGLIEQLIKLNVHKELTGLDVFEIKDTSRNLSLIAWPTLIDKAQSRPVVGSKDHRELGFWVRYPLPNKTFALFNTVFKEYLYVHKDKLNTRDGTNQTYRYAGLNVYGTLNPDCVLYSDGLINQTITSDQYKFNLALDEEEQNPSLIFAQDGGNKFTFIKVGVSK